MVQLLAYLGSLMGLIAIIDRLIPRSVWQLLEHKFKTSKLLSWFSWHTKITIEEFASFNMSDEVYDLVEFHVSFLNSNARHHSARRLRLSQLKNASKPSYNPDSNQLIEDTFQGATFIWELQVHDISKKSGGGVRRTYVVTAHKRYNTLLFSYMEYVMAHGRKLRHEIRDRKLFTNNIQSREYQKSWRSVPFKHASTFESMALPEETKEMVKRDLEAFIGGEGFFKRVGRAWKRGYLLYGPPGTGKSSLIAAIANYMQFDVYDLELTEVKSNANLRELLMGVRNKSIIVIEDIDCSLELKKRGDPAPDGPPSDPKEDEAAAKKEGNEKSRVTLSGLLNFIDGLWSCIGDERIVIFTTNHKDKLDPALLRSGRMDLHILLSYCGFEAFRTLAWTHLEIREHRLFGEIEGLLETAQMTPADVAEVLIRNRHDPNAALEILVKALAEAAHGKRDSDAGKGVDLEEELDPALTEPIHAV